jgi:hypothetical protein
MSDSASTLPQRNVVGDRGCDPATCGSQPFRRVGRAFSLAFPEWQEGA